MGFTIIPDAHCPTWKYLPHVGWRGFMIRRLRLPKRWFRPEARERVLYRMGDVVICSFETFAELRTSKFSEEA